MPFIIIPLYGNRDTEKSTDFPEVIQLVRPAHLPSFFPSNTLEPASSWVLLVSYFSRVEGSSERVEL